MAEFMHLQTESETAPIYFYINSAGVQVPLCHQLLLLAGCHLHTVYNVDPTLLRLLHSPEAGAKGLMDLLRRGAVTRSGTRARPSPSTT